MASLLELRKEAEKLGIEDYAQYSKVELQKKVDEKKNSVPQTEEIPDSVVEVAAEEVDPTDAEEVVQKEQSDEVEEISAEEAEKLNADQTEKPKRGRKSSKTPKEKKEKKVREKKEPKEKKPKMIFQYKYTPKKEKPEKIGEKTSLIYDELVKSNESCYSIAKKLGTYFSFVDKVVQTYFDMEKIQVAKEA